MVLGVRGHRPATDGGTHRTLWLSVDSTDVTSRGVETSRHNPTPSSPRTLALTSRPGTLTLPSRDPSTRFGCFPLETGPVSTDPYSLSKGSVLHTFVTGLVRDYLFRTSPEV